MSSTNPASFSVSVWIAAITPAAADTDRQASIAAGVVPQSSCSLNPAAPARSCSHRASADTVLPLPSSTMFTGQASVASSIRARCHAPGVTVVALVPSAGPVPPPISVVIPPPSASGSCVGEIMCTWQSIPPAVRISPLPAITSVDGPITRSGWTPSMMSGLPALPIARDPAVPDADVGLDDAPVVEDDRAGDDQVGRALGARGDAWPIDSRITFPPPKTASSPPAHRSRSTSMSSEVSASRIRSPAVGPYSSA